MAEAVVSAIIGEAISRVISLLTEPSSHQQSPEAKMRRICHLLTRIHSVVEEAKGRQITNDGVLQWLLELIDGEYQGRYLLDMIGCSEQKELEDSGCDGNMVEIPPQASFFSQFNPAKRMRVTAGAMKSMLSKKDFAADEIDRVLEILQGVSSDLGEFIMLLQGYQSIRRPLPTNIFLDGQMFGRHVDKERIINFLLHNYDRSVGELGVLPIVGDIGVGKTTLVQHSCDDDRVRTHFSVIIFFSFSCTYAIATSEGIAVGLRSKHVISDAQISLNDPLEWIKGNLNKRFLIVFEDVDMRKKQMLADLMLKLRCAEQGSKVIFTTNNRLVASLGTVDPIILKALPSPEYWFFFKAQAFAGRDLEENPRLVMAGKAIAKKLNGSFFGAKIIGGLLKDHPDPKFWCKVMRSNIGGLSLLGDGISYLADLSQNLLPNHVNVYEVDISNDPFASQTELARFQDLCEAHGSETGFADNASFARVLLCKSVMPSYNQYFIASCTVGSGNSCYELAMVSSNSLLHDVSKI